MTNTVSHGPFPHGQSLMGSFSFWKSESQLTDHFRTSLITRINMIKGYLRPSENLSQIASGVTMTVKKIHRKPQVANSIRAMNDEVIPPHLIRYVGNDPATRLATWEIGSALFRVRIHIAHSDSLSRKVVALCESEGRYFPSVLWDQQYRMSWVSCSDGLARFPSFRDLIASGVWISPHSRWVFKNAISPEWLKMELKVKVKLN
jgi:hypothetical protein